MRTLKKALSLVLVLALLCSVCVFSASATNFTDDADIEYTEAVDVLVQIGVIDGMGDGTFNPKGNLTRAQASKIICYLLLGSNTNKLEDSTTGSTFTDVIGSGHDWASPYIEYCVNAGIVGGYGDGRFGPGDQLTGFQFAKMLLCALGYDAAIEGYTGNAWTVAVAGDIIDANLDDGLPGGFNYNAPLTRDEACQMAFNWLKADMVEYDTKGTTIVTGDGTTVVTGASTAEPMENRKNTDGNIKGDGRMQAAERYFPDLKQTKSGAADDFGRPANTWKDKTTEIGTYTDKSDLIATFNNKVTLDQLYKLIGKSSVNDLKDKWGQPVNGVENNTLEVYVDGQNYKVTADDVAKYFNSGNTGTFNTLDYMGVEKGAAVPVPATGYGSYTEVYQTDENNVTIVVINEYLVQATNDYNAQKEELAVETVGFAYEQDMKLDDDTLDVDDFPAVANATEDDYLVVTLALQDNGKFEVKTAQPAKLVGGTVDSFVNNTFKPEFGNLKIDGTTYNYAVTSAAKADDGYATQFTTNEETSVVTDANGYILFVDEANATNSYIFVYDIYSDSKGMSNAFKGDAFNLDGTTPLIDVDKVDGSKPTGDEGPAWYKFSTTSANKYKLTDKSETDGDDTFFAKGTEGKVITSGDANFVTGEDIQGDGKTIFIVNAYENDTNEVGDVAVYTGVKDVPDVYATNGNVEVYWIENSDGIVTHVFVNAHEDDVDSSTAISNDYTLIMVHNGQGTAGDNTYTEVDTIVNGAWARLNVADGSEENFPMWTLVHKIKTDVDGYADNATAIVPGYKSDDFKFITLNNSEVTYSNGTLTFKNGTCAVEGEKPNVTLSDDCKIQFVIAGDPFTGATDAIMDDPSLPYDLSGLNCSGKTVQSDLKGYLVSGYVVGVRVDDNSNTVNQLWVVINAAVEALQDDEGGEEPPAPTTYTVNYDLNKPEAATGDISPASVEAGTTTQTGAFTLSTTALTLDGYTFGGWALTAGGEPVTTIDIVEGTTTYTVYAIWTPVT